MKTETLEALREVISEWKNKPKDYTYQLKQVFGTETHLYFVNSVQFIRNGLTLPLNMTSETFDINHPDSINQLKALLDRLDETFRNYVDKKLDDFPAGVTELF